MHSWRFLGARSRAEARAYYMTSLQRSWGCLIVREMARHRLRRVCYVGAGHRPRAAQAQGAPREQWDLHSPAEFHGYAVRSRGALAAPGRAALARLV